MTSVEAFARRLRRLRADLGALPEVINEAVAGSFTAPTKSC